MAKRIPLASCALTLTAIALSLARPSAQTTTAARHPNIVIILADDLGYGDLGSYNPDSKIPTPTLDRLAAEGMRFTDAHSTSGVCTPSRYALLTGRYSWRTSLKRGVLNGYSPLLIEKDRMTLASLVRQRGYGTAIIGKWHLGLGTAQSTDFSRPLEPGPNALGFDHFFGIAASLDMPPYVFVENASVTAAPTGTVAASEHHRRGGSGFWRAGAIAPGFTHAGVLPALTERAISFISHQSVDKPFLLYLALTAPHTPWMPTPEFQGKSGAGPYGDFVGQVDVSVGRVLHALDSAKLRENTLVIFTSDNGAHWLPSDIEKWGHRANGRLRGQKADIWEGGHRVPFVARWPGRIPAGTTRPDLIGLVDLFATIAAIVDVPLPRDAGEDSVNVLPLLLDAERTSPIRQSIVHHSGEGVFAIRRGAWKLSLALGSGGFSEPREVLPKPGGPEGELYNLEADPEEQHNLWLHKPEIVTELKALLNKIQSEGRSR